MNLQLLAEFKYLLTIQIRDSTTQCSVDTTTMVFLIDVLLQTGLEWVGPSTQLTVVVSLTALKSS